MESMAAAPVQSSTVRSQAAEARAAVRAVTPADRQALEELYRAHHQVIWRTLRRMGFSPEAAADHTQQAYLIALERLDRILPGSERAFLFSTAIFFGRTVLRKERRMELSDEVDAGSDGGAAARGVDQRQIALDLLERILDGMDPDLVTVFTLYEIEGLSSPEIAELLGIPLGTVASRLRRAREAFRSRAARAERGPNIVKRTLP
jgi:RNA polymerase sigma-70 factor, ECF subfamily